MKDNVPNKRVKIKWLKNDRSGLYICRHSLVNRNTPLVGFEMIHPLRCLFTLFIAV